MANIMCDSSNCWHAVNKLAKRLSENFLILISGPTCSGKSFFASGLDKYFPRSALVGGDAYFRDVRDQLLPKDERGRFLFDVPNAYRGPELRRDIIALLSGRDIFLPDYDIRENRIVPGVGLKVKAGNPAAVEFLFAIKMLSNACFFNKWQRDFQIGWLDLPLMKYALEVCGGVDYLAITNLDRLAEIEQVKVVEAYGFLRSDSGEAKKFLDANFKNLRKVSKTTRERQEEVGGFISRCRPKLVTVGGKVSKKSYREYVGWLERGLGEKARLLSFGPKASDKIFIV
jgi:Adenylosuccinate synthetase